MTDQATKLALAKQLTENTGRHMLDSGGAYGRAWELNQSAVAAAAGKPLAEVTDEELVAIFEARPTVVEHEAFVTLDVFHYLAARVTFDAELNEAFDAFVTEHGDRDRDWTSEAVAFIEHRGCKVDGSGYTYNFENALSQDVIYTEWGQDGERYVALQIHGGCDARGGFTRPVIYAVDDTYWLHDCGDVNYYCSGRERPQDETLFVHEDGYYDHHFFYSGEVTDLTVAKGDDGEFAGYVCPTCGGKLSAEAPEPST